MLMLRCLEADFFMNIRIVGLELSAMSAMAGAADILPFGTATIF